MHAAAHAPKPFAPAWWLRNPHLQTFWPPCVRRCRGPALSRERVELPDGDFLDLDWVRRSRHTHAPTVLVLHGLEGSSRSVYARGMLGALAACGWRAAVMHFRGCSGEPNRRDRGYHSGDTGDLAYVASRLSPDGASPLMAVGFSLGGNVLLKWLGETGARNPLAAAVAVSVPMVLGECAARLERGLSRLYQHWLMRSMRRSVWCKFAHRGAGAPIDLDRAARSKSFREFDDAVTAPLHGFDGVDDYYRRSSARQHLSAVAVPTLLIQAADDPFMTKDVIPSPGELSPALTFELCERGGHVGFISGRIPGKAEYWLETRVPAFFRGVLAAGADI